MTWNECLAETNLCELPLKKLRVTPPAPLAEQMPVQDLAPPRSDFWAATSERHREDSALEIHSNQSWHSGTIAAIALATAATEGTIAAMAQIAVACAAQSIGQASKTSGVPFVQREEHLSTWTTCSTWTEGQATQFCKSPQTEMQDVAGCVSEGVGFAAGDRVWYWSQSKQEWIKAVVVSRLERNGNDTYDLNCKRGVSIDRIRGRSRPPIADLETAKVLAVEDRWLAKLHLDDGSDMVSSTAAQATIQPPRVACASKLEGTWWDSEDNSIMIYEHSLLWSNGVTSALTRPSSNEVEIMIKGRSYRAALQEDRLIWNDGDVWSRSPSWPVAASLATNCTNVCTQNSFSCLEIDMPQHDKCTDNSAMQHGKCEAAQRAGIAMLVPGLQEIDCNAPLERFLPNVVSCERREIKSIATRCMACERKPQASAGPRDEALWASRLPPDVVSCDRKDIVMAVGEDETRGVKQRANSDSPHPALRETDCMDQPAHCPSDTVPCDSKDSKSETVQLATVGSPLPVLKEICDDDMPPHCLPDTVSCSHTNSESAAIKDGTCKTMHRAGAVPVPDLQETGCIVPPTRLLSDIVPCNPKDAENFAAPNVQLEGLPRVANASPLPVPQEIRGIDPPLRCLSDMVSCDRKDVVSAVIKNGICEDAHRAGAVPAPLQRDITCTASPTLRVPDTFPCGRKDVEISAAQTGQLEALRRTPNALVAPELHETLGTDPAQRCLSGLVSCDRIDNESATRKDGVSAPQLIETGCIVPESGDIGARKRRLLNAISCDLVDLPNKRLRRKNTSASLVPLQFASMGRYEQEPSANRSLGSDLRQVAQDLHLSSVITADLSAKDAKVTSATKHKHNRNNAGENKGVSRNSKVVNTSASAFCPNQTVCKRFGAELTQKQLSCLAPGQWLNDEVINCYIRLVQEKSGGQLWCPNSFFWPKLAAHGYKSVQRWAKRAKVIVLKLRAVVIPLFLHGNHWALGVIDMNMRAIRYFDSLGHKVPDGLVQRLREYVDGCGCAALESAGSPVRATPSCNWPLLPNVPSLPQQQNGSDCGVFACMYAERFAAAATMNFRISGEAVAKMRRKIAKAIVLGHI